MLKFYSLKNFVQLSIKIQIPLYIKSQAFDEPLSCQFLFCRFLAEFLCLKARCTSKLPQQRVQVAILCLLKVSEASISCALLYDCFYTSLHIDYELGIGLSYSICDDVQLSEYAFLCSRMLFSNSNNVNRYISTGELSVLRFATQTRQSTPSAHLPSDCLFDM